MNEKTELVTIGGKLCGIFAAILCATIVFSQRSYDTCGDQEILQQSEDSSITLGVIENQTSQEEIYQNRQTCFVRQGIDESMKHTCMENTCSQHLSRELQADKEQEIYIPTISLGLADGCFSKNSGNTTSGRPVDSLTDEIGTACRQIGFMQITDHGIPQQELEMILAESKRFFAMPQHTKLSRRPLNRSHSTRGYFGRGDENLDILDAESRARAVDQKEGFDMGNEATVGQIRGSFGAPNLFPDETSLPLFRSRMNAHHNKLVRLARHLLRYIALALGEDVDFFDQVTTTPISTLRLLHYWPTSRNDSSAIGAGAHTDYGLLTLLLQDSVGGLQVLNRRSGEWLHVPPTPGALVVNLGDMMQRWSQGQFRSTIHRVINDAAGESHRYSVPFFFNPNIDTRIVPFAKSAPNRPEYTYVADPGKLERDAAGSNFPTCGEILTDFYAQAGLLPAKAKADTLVQRS